jgi:hypothetical protein
MGRDRRLLVPRTQRAYRFRLASDLSNGWDREQAGVDLAFWRRARIMPDGSWGGAVTGIDVQWEFDAARTKLSKGHCGNS